MVIDTTWSGLNVSGSRWCRSACANEQRRYISEQRERKDRSNRGGGRNETQGQPKEKYAVILVQEDWGMR